MSTIGCPDGKINLAVKIYIDNFIETFFIYALLLLENTGLNDDIFNLGFARGKSNLRRDS